MFWILLLVFIILPLVELTLLLLLAEVTQWWVSLLVVIVSGVVGSYLAHRQGWHTWRRIREELQGGQLPTDSLLDAFMIFVAGALLVTPGLLTDAFGMSLLIPPCRRFYKRRMINWFKAKFKIHTYGGMRGERSEVIDSYVVDRSDAADASDEAKS